MESGHDHSIARFHNLRACSGITNANNTLYRFIPGSVERTLSRRRIHLKT